MRGQERRERSMDSHNPKKASSPYDVDEILEEARRLKEARLKRQQGGGSPASGVSAGADAHAHPPKPAAEPASRTPRETAVAPASGASARPGSAQGTAAQGGAGSGAAPSAQAARPPKPAPISPVKQPPNPAPLPKEPVSPRPAPVKGTQEPRKGSQQEAASAAPAPREPARPLIEKTPAAGIPAPGKLSQPAKPAGAAERVKPMKPVKLVKPIEPAAPAPFTKPSAAVVPIGKPAVEPVAEPEETPPRVIVYPTDAQPAAVRVGPEQRAAPPREPAEDVKIYVPHTPAPARKSSPAELSKTLVLHTFKGEDDLDQIRMESLLEASDEPEETPDKEKPAERAEIHPLPLKPQTETQDETDQDLEERLQEKRRKKAENFKLHPAFKLSGEEEENDPSEEPEIFEDEELEDYSSYEEAEAVRSELNYRRRMGWLQLALTGAIAAVLLGVSVVMGLLELPLLNATLLISLNLFLLGVAALINHRAVGGGLAALFRMKASADSAVGACVVVVLLQTAAQFLNLDSVSAGQAILLAPVAALGLFLNALGRQMRVLRISRNFHFASYRGEKYAAKIVEDSRAAVDIGRSAVALGEPVVCYMQKTGFLTHFLRNSYEGDAADHVMKLYVPVSLIASLVLGAVYGLFSRAADAWLNALTVFASAVCLSAPLAALSATNFPLLRAAGRVLRRGAMLIGWRAAEEFGGAHALAVDALDLFPSESVLLHGIKTFSGTRIDEAILDAAAVSIAAGGPLSSVFRRVIQDRTDILQSVDTLVYEQDMGMSGWVGGRRVLIGNRRLLENHGVDVPSRDYETRYAKDGRQLVYLSTAGELSAMFVVSYTADEGISDALEALESAGITLLVRTCDPNVTEDLVCRVFGLDPYYVEIMGAPAGRRYEQLVAEEQKQDEAVMASNGRLEGIAYALAYCRRLWGASRLAVALQVIGGAVGFALSTVFSLYTGYFLPALFLVVYTLFWLFVSWVLPCIRRV